MGEYQEHYTDSPVARENMKDEEGRGAKAEKVGAVLEDFLGDV